jgi:hypothetical protein
VYGALPAVTIAKKVLSLQFKTVIKFSDSVLLFVGTVNNIFSLAQTNVWLYATDALLPNAAMKTFGRL